VPNGLLGKKALPAAANHTLCTIPDGKVTTLSLNVVNRTTGPIPLRVWLGAAAPTNDDAIEYDVVIEPNGVLERTGLVASAGENLVVWAGALGLTARAMGFEEDA
jgi:hypothetical protein